MSDENLNRVGFRHIRGDDYRVVPASDAMGGLTPRGDVVVHFFIDYPTVADGVVIHKVNEDGSLGEREDDRDLRVIDRHLQTGVILTVEAAERIAEWLQKQVEKARDEQSTGTSEGEG